MEGAQTMVELWKKRENSVRQSARVQQGRACHSHGAALVSMPSSRSSVSARRSLSFSSVVVRLLQKRQMICDINFS